MALLLAASAQPAQAQFAGSLNLASNDIFRGHSTSGDNPALTGSVAFDHHSGLYLGGTLSGMAGEHHGPRFNATTQFAGWATQAGRISFDAGVIHRRYSRFYTAEYARDYFEAYAGISGRDLGVRLFYSPDFDNHGRSAVYSEVNATLLSRERFSLTAHIGGLAPPKEPGEDSRSVELDWRLGLSRRFVPFTASLDLIGSNAYGDGRATHHKAMISISRVF